MVKEACEKRSRGEHASVRAMRGHNKMPAGDEEEESEEEASSSSRASASTIRRRSTTTGGGGGSEVLGARSKGAPAAMRRPLDARRHPTPNEDQPPADDQERQLVQIKEEVHNERWDIPDEELFFNKKDRIAHHTRECAGSRAEARYVCTWCFAQELRMQDVEEEHSVPVIVRDWKPVLTTDYGVRYHYSLNGGNTEVRCAGVRGRGYARIPG